MQVLITGGSGFLGTAIIRRLLDSDIQVRAISRTGEEKHPLSGNNKASIEWRRGDVAVSEDVLTASAGCDAIIHLAGVLTPFCKNDPVAGAMVNVIGTLNVFEAAKRHSIDKVIYSSSGGVFGPDDSSVPLPTTHYGAFKLANEAAARAYWADDRIASIGFRPFVVYGPGRERGLSAGPTLACRAAARNERYTLPLTGKIGLVYIDDVAASFVAGLQATFAGAHVFNLPGTELGITDIIEKIRHIVPEAQLDCAGDPLPMVSTTRNDYFNDLLEVPPAVSVDAGLRRTIEHYRNAV